MRRPRLLILPLAAALILGPVVASPAYAAFRASSTGTNVKKSSTEAEKKKAAESEAKRKAEEAAKKKAAEEAARKAAEAAKKKAAEEAARKAAAEAEKKKAAEYEAKRKAAEAEAKRKAGEAEEAKRKAEEAKRKAEEEQRKPLSEFVAIGTITAVDAGAGTVTLTVVNGTPYVIGRTITVRVPSGTPIKFHDAPIDLSSLPVGGRIVVQGNGTAGGLVARQIIANVAGSGEQH
jgi:hypothetical protein